MGKLSSLLLGAGIGAGLMYFMDPQLGDRRKAMVRDRVARMQQQGDEAIETAMYDMRNRVSGIMAEGMARVSNESLPDNLLEEHVRSRLGFLTRHPGAIQIAVQNGQATLSGDILADEEPNLVKSISRMRGVNNVQNNLSVHQDAGNLPQLQGEGWMPGQNGAQWSPSTRLLASVGAGYLVVYGLARGGLVGIISTLGGVVLGSRALTNLDLRQMTGMSPQENAIRVRKSINIDAPVDKVYSLWSNFENFPQFMNNIESIKDKGNGESHWIVKGPAGSKVEFDAVITENKPNQVVAWETKPDSQVKHSGQVRFRESPKQGTTVNVNMAYTPPAGAAGHIVASLFGKDPKTEMDQDLARMKTLLEQGETTAKNRKVRQDQVMPVTGATSEMGGMEGQSSTGQQSGGPMGRQGSERSNPRNRDEEEDDEGMAPLTGSDL